MSRLVRFLSVGVGLQIVALAALLASTTVKGGPATGELGSRTAPPGVQIPVTLEAGAEIARAAADAWSPGTRLVAAHGLYRWPLPETGAPETVPAKGWLVYTFARGTASLSVWVDPGSGVVFSQRGASFVPGLGRAGLQTTYPISSSIALLAAERIGGTTYRAACPSQRTRSNLALTTATDGEPWWVVTYGPDDSPDAGDIRIVFDANSGNVVSTRIDSPPCS